MFTSRLSDYYQIILVHVNIAINKAALHMCECNDERFLCKGQDNVH